jgi:parallel beta-helix repeat protein
LTGSDILFEKNKVLDLIKVMLVSENHDDLFQAFTAVPGVGPACKNDTIRGNLFVNTTDTNRPFVGVTQGIGCFNGPFENWIVENNIVMTDHYHGISFYDATNCKIVNNTVMDPYLVTPVDPFENNSSSTGPAWIYLDGASTNNIVKNNLANTMNFASGVNTTAASNYSIGSISSYANYFVNVSNIAVPGSFDLHLKPGSLPINRGDNVDAPLVDFDGVARPQGAKVDCGAYEFVQSTAIPELKNAENGLKTYPNPFQNELNIDINAAFPQNYRVDILNLSGQIVFTESKNADTKLILNNISALLNGVYILKLTDESGNFSQNRICKVN